MFKLYSKFQDEQRKIGSFLEVKAHTIRFVKFFFNNLQVKNNN